MPNQFLVPQNNQMQPSNTPVPVSGRVVKALDRLRGRTTLDIAANQAGVMVAIDRIEGQTMVEMAHTQGEAMVARGKVREISDATQFAMMKHTEVSHLNDALAGGNPVLHEELRDLSILGRVGMATILNDLVDEFRNQ
jgi:hypothetical protein